MNTAQDILNAAARHIAMVEAVEADKRIRDELIKLGWTPPRQTVGVTTLSHRVRAGSEAAPWVVEAIALIEQQRNQAIRHLHAILNNQRTATQAWQAEQEARQWLDSIGSEPT